MVNLGVEGLAHLARIAREINHHAVGIDPVDGEAVRLEPICDGGQVLWHQSVSRSELLRGQPMMVVRRFRVLEFIEVFFECLLLLGRASQLEPQMLHRKAVIDRAAIIGRICASGRVLPASVISRVSSIGPTIRVACEAAFCARGATMNVNPEIANAAAQKIAITPIRIFPQDTFTNSSPFLTAAERTTLAFPHRSVDKRSLARLVVNGELLNILAPWLRTAYERAFQTVWSRGVPFVPSD